MTGGAQGPHALLADPVLHSDDEVRRAGLIAFVAYTSLQLALLTLRPSIDAFSRGLIRTARNHTRITNSVCGAHLRLRLFAALIGESRPGGSAAASSKAISA